MVSKVQGSRAQSIQAPKAEASKAPPKAEAQAPAKNTGWTPKAGGAGKVAQAQGGGASQVKLLSAAIDSLPGSEALVPPKGYAASVSTHAQKLSQKLPDGRTATLDWNSESLSVKGPNGKTVTLVPKDDVGFKQYSADFKDNFKGAKKEDVEMYGSVEWDSSRSFSGVGSAGKMMSVSENLAEYMGGAHPNYMGTLQTFDASTGKRVSLDQLLSKEQFQSIVSTIEKKLPKLTGQDGVEGNSFVPFDGGIAKHVADNFALTTDAKGNTQITVAWMSGVHAMGDLAATFTFAAPTDAAFRQKIGLE